jgi:hypothetical protein
VTGGVRSAWLTAGVCCLVLCGARATHAQSNADARLLRLDASTRVAIEALVDSARRQRLPTEPLVDKALEGEKKGADGDRILVAVRSLSAELRSARIGLGAASGADEITAGANALHAGMSMRDLARLRAAAQHAGRARVTLPLTVATDLVARGVPIAVVTDIVLSLARAGLRDADFTMLQRNVRLDIEHGADATAAAQTRARGAILHAGRVS